MLSITTSRESSETYTARLLLGTNELSEHEMPPFEQSISRLSTPRSLNHRTPPIEIRFISARSPDTTSIVHIAARLLKPLTFWPPPV